MSFSSFLRNYLSFSRRDQYGVLLLLVAIVVVAWVVPYCLSGNSPAQQTPPADAAQFAQQIRVYSAAIDSAQQSERQNRRAAYHQQYPQRYPYQSKYRNYDHNDPYPHKRETSDDEATAYLDAPLSPFDPNKLDFRAARQLGLPARTAHTIVNYLEKGGHFYSKESFRKIYNLSEADYMRLAPYLQIEKSASAATTSRPTAAYPTDSSSQQRPSTYGYPARPTNTNTNKLSPKPLPHPIYLNSSDSSEWLQLSGIGAKFTQRIIAYRQKLGGFARKEQLKEVFGMTDDLYNQISPYLKEDEKNITKININTADLESLKSTPTYGTN